MRKFLENVKSMNGDDLVENIDAIYSAWDRIRLYDEIQKEKALVFAGAILGEKRIGRRKRLKKEVIVRNAFYRAIQGYRIDEAYDRLNTKLIKMCNGVDQQNFKRLYNKVLPLLEELREEQKSIREIFKENNRYKDVKRGRSFIAKINPTEWDASLFDGCKKYLLYEIGQKRKISNKFKNRNSKTLIRLVATAKHHGLNANDARSYAYLLMKTRPKQKRIEALYKKL